MNSLQEQVFHNQRLCNRLTKEKIPYTWGNIGHLLESDAPIWVAIISVPMKQGSVDIWISYSEYQATYLFDSVAGEAFNDTDARVSLDMTIALLREFIPKA